MRQSTRRAEVRAATLLAGALSIMLTLTGLPFSHAGEAQARSFIDEIGTDSISVMLFAGLDARAIAIASPRGLVISASRNGEASEARVRSRGSLRIGINGAVMTAGADTVEECIVRADGEIRMSVGMKTKVLRGLVTITRRDDELLIVGRMARRDYLAAALAAETSAREPIEYLTAVSVVQRNYVDAHPERHAPLADLCDNTHCQLANLRDASPRVFDAVDRASAIHLRSDDAFPSYYSVNCGGATLTPAQVWKRAEPGYASVDCDHCRQSKWHRWQRTVAARPGVESVMRSAPATPFIDDDFKMRAGRTFGFNVVLSNTIDRIERHGQHYLVAGRGFGHRIGLCQDGARQLARSGRDAVDILRFYFPTGRVTVAVAP